MINIETLLNALPSLVPLATNIPAIGSLVEEVVEALAPKDKETAKARLEELIEQNRIGHEALQKRLDPAADFAPEA